MSLLTLPYSFCRKTTMIKHQRRAHQHEFHPDDIVDACDAESDIMESPLTPHGQPEATWPLQAVPPGVGSMQSTDVVHHQDEYSISHGYQRRPSMPQANMVPLNMSPPGQNTGVQVIHDIHNMTQAPMYVTDQGNPRVATMNSNAIPRTYYLHQQQEDHPRIDIPCTVHEFHVGDQHSPSNLSAASYQSSQFNDEGPSGQTTNSTTSSFCDAASTDECQPLAQYAPPMSQQIDSAQRSMSCPSQEVALQDATSHLQEISSAMATRGWANFQPSIEVTTIGHLPIFGSGLHGLFLGPKLGFEDPSMQLPSARLESL